MKTATFHRPILVVIGLMIVTSCQAPPKGEPAETALTPGTRAPAPRRVMLIETPKRIREDVRSPAATKMGFFWSDNSAEWRIKLPSGTYGHGGFRFWLPHNLAVHRNSFEVRFKIAPATMVNYLWFGLVDGTDRTPRALVDLPMKNYAPDAKGIGFTEVRIPIRDFSSIGSVASLDGETTEQALDAPFDWSDVAELRIIHNGGRLPNREIIITDLRFER